MQHYILLVMFWPKDRLTGTRTWIQSREQCTRTYILLICTHLSDNIKNASLLVILSNTKIPQILILLRQTGCVCANRPLFQRFSLQNYNFFVWKAVWCDQMQASKTTFAVLWWIFRQQIGRRFLDKPPCQRMRRLEEFLYKLLRTLNQEKKFEIKIKNFKHSIFSHKTLPIQHTPTLTLTLTHMRHIVTSCIVKKG